MFLLLHYLPRFQNLRYQQHLRRRHRRPDTEQLQLRHHRCYLDQLFLHHPMCYCYYNHHQNHQRHLQLCPDYYHHHNRRQLLKRLNQ